MQAVIYLSIYLSQDKVKVNIYCNYGLRWQERCRSFHHEAYTGDVPERKRISQ